MKGRDFLVGALAGAVLVILFIYNGPAATSGSRASSSARASAQAQRQSPPGSVPATPGPTVAAASRSQLPKPGAAAGLAPAGGSGGSGIGYLTLAIAGLIAIALLVFMVVRFQALTRRLEDTEELLSARYADQLEQAESRLSARQDEARKLASEAQLLASQLRDQQGSARTAVRDDASEQREWARQLRAELRHELQSELQGEALRVQEASQQLEPAVRDLETQLKETASALTDAQRWLGEQHEWTARQFTDVTRDIAYLDQRLLTVRQLVRQRLEHEMRPDGGGHRILAGAVSTGQVAAADGLHQLYAAFCQALPLEIVFQEPGGDSGTRFYLSWTSPDGAAPEPLLEELLRGCADGDGASPAGLNELRCLLLGLHYAAPSAAQVGPMTVHRTGDRLVVRIGESAGEARRLLDLTSWAQSQVSQLEQAELRQPAS